jgi:hypothetical protein
MLRNLNTSSSGRRILGVPTVGVLGSTVAGEVGGVAGLLFNDVASGSLFGDLVRAEVLTHNLPDGTLFVWEDGSFSVVGAPDGVYTLFYRLWVNGVAATVDLGYGPGVGVITITVGAAVTLPVPVILPYESFLSDILPYVPGAPDDIVIQHLRRACIEFYQRTEAWRVKLPAVSALEGYTEYAMPLPTQAALAKMKAYYINGVQAAVATVGQGDDAVAFGSNHDAVWTLNKTTFYVNPPPATGDLMKLDVSLKPSQASSGIYDFLYEQHAEHLRDGALARMFAMPGQPWTSLELATYHKGMFEAAVNRVGLSSSKGHGGRMRVQAHTY